MSFQAYEKYNPRPLNQSLNLRELRQKLRIARQSLSPPEREKKSFLVHQHLSGYLPFRRAKSLAAYWATNEEVATAAPIEHANYLGKSIYLPVVNTARWRSERMYFQRYIPRKTLLIPNRFGIPEPEHRPGTPIRSNNLDLILVPLVGFNQSCDRIGMGGGYYDHALSGPRLRKTKFVGLAFTCQKAEFEPMPHDIRLDAIVTEDGIIGC